MKTETASQEIEIYFPFLTENLLALIYLNFGNIKKATF